MEKLYAFFVTFSGITLAEIGDKTQFMVLGFAMLYPLWEVLITISVATGILMFLAVVTGCWIGKILPCFYTQFFAGMFFILWGIWNFYKKEKKIHKYINSIFTIFYTFLLAELGDKTQIATLTFSAKFNQPFFVWSGATCGMILANVLAAFVGKYSKKYFNNKVLKLITSLIFILFGIVTLIEAIFKHKT